MGIETGGGQREGGAPAQRDGLLRENWYMRRRKIIAMENQKIFRQNIIKQMLRIFRLGLRSIRFMTKKLGSGFGVMTRVSEATSVT